MESERRREERKNAERMLICGIKMVFRKCSFYPESGICVVRTEVEDGEWYIGDVLGLQDLKGTGGQEERGVVKNREVIEEEVDVEGFSDSENVELQGEMAIVEANEVGVNVDREDGEERMLIAEGGDILSLECQEELVTEVVVDVVAEKLVMHDVVGDEDVEKNEEYALVVVEDVEKVEECVVVVGEDVEKIEKCAVVVDEDVEKMDIHDVVVSEDGEEREEDEEVTTDQLLVTDEEFDNLFGKRRESSDDWAKDSYAVRNLMKDLYSEVSTDMEDGEKVEVVMQQVEVRVENVMRMGRRKMEMKWSASLT